MKKTNFDFLKEMPIISQEIEINVGLKRKLRFLQDFNCRFTKDPILFSLWRIERIDLRSL